MLLLPRIQAPGCLSDDSPEALGNLGDLGTLGSRRLLEPARTKGPGRAGIQDASQGIQERLAPADMLVAGLENTTIILLRRRDGDPTTQS